MSSNGVVSIRVEAPGVSITIFDGNCDRADEPRCAKAGTRRNKCSDPSNRAAVLTESPPTQPGLFRPTTERLPLPRDDSTVQRDSKAPVSDERAQTADRPPSPNQNGPADLPRKTKPAVGSVVAQRSETNPLWNDNEIAKLAAPPEPRSRADGRRAGLKTEPGSPVKASPNGQDLGSANLPWSDEEVEKLTALWPTHSIGAIAEQFGRSYNAVRAKARSLRLKKDGPPTVTSKPAEPAPKPRPLSAAVTSWNSLTGLLGEDAVLTGFPGDSDSSFAHAHALGGVSLLDHHAGQCRWIVSDVWPVMYCGAPVLDSSSWCEQHSRRVFNPDRKRRTARESKEPHA